MQIQDSGKLACHQSRPSLPPSSRHWAGLALTVYHLESVRRPNISKSESQVLKGTEGYLCQMDAILVFGKSFKEHDEHLKETLCKLQEANLTLNEEKCEFAKPSVEFLGTIVNAEGIQVDPKKVEAITKMAAPQHPSELRFLGMVNQLSKFQPHIAELTKPLRDLLSTKNHWTWGEIQQEAFSSVKNSLATPTLALHDASRQTKLSTDASSYGLGAVLLQNHDDQWYPVAYAPRAMSATEQRYAHIEKEALGITWASELFADYLIGLKFHIETDHKPLVPLLSTKNLEELPARVQRFRMSMMRFSYSTSHVPGKNLCTADTLSRAQAGREAGK